MTTYKIPTNANQEFDIDIGETQLFFHVREYRGVMYCTVENIDGDVICASVRCINNGWILPEGTLSGGGNVRFEDNNGMYPYYTNFGISCFLRYYTGEEIAEGV